MFYIENYLDEAQGRELKRTIINVIQEERNLKKTLTSISMNLRRVAKTCLNDVQENTSIKMNEMMQTIQDLKCEFSQGIKQRREFNMK